MCRFLTVMLAMLLLALDPAQAENGAEDKFLERMGAYIALDDVEAAKPFYEMLLNTKPEVQFPGFVGYDVAGGLLALVSRAQFAPDAGQGERTVPYIKVPDVTALYRRIRDSEFASSVGEPIIEPMIAILKVRDPEGNLVEFYSIP